MSDGTVTKDGNPGFAYYTPGEYARENIRITPTTLSDGRDFFYLDDEPEYVSGERTRELHDPRDLPDRFAPHRDADGKLVPYQEPRMRRDPLTGDWIPMATARMNRPITVGKGATVAGNPLAARKPGSEYQDGEIPDVDYDTDLEGLRAGGVDGWAAYPVGVAWALRREGFPSVRGFDAAFVSCVPLGSGLSSSAAMTCSTALALDGVFSLGCAETDEGRIRLIQAAMSVENDMAGASTGGLDQSASLRATAGHALLLDFRPELSAMDSARQKPFDLERFGLELLVVDTRAPHQLNDGQYAQRRSACESAAKLLGVANLRVLADRILSSEDRQGALEEVLNRLPDATTRKRVRHVITEIGRVPRFIEAFGRGDVDEAARLFDASHQSLADDYEVTVPELDVAVEVARRMGAHGARMTGGGFGGPSSRWSTKARAAMWPRPSPRSSRLVDSDSRSILPRLRRRRDAVRTSGCGRECHDRG